MVKQKQLRHGDGLCAPIRTGDGDDFGSTGSFGPGVKGVPTSQEIHRRQKAAYVGAVVEDLVTQVHPWKQLRTVVDLLDGEPHHLHSFVARRRKLKSKCLRLVLQLSKCC